MDSDSARKAGTAAAAAIPLAYLLYRALARSKRREARIRHADERVLIIGASSGVGRAVAKKYAARGARVCVVARRAEQVAALASECGEKCIAQVADFTNPDDMVRVRETILAEWGGLDTLQISAGVSALRPIMHLAGVESDQEDASSAGIHEAVNIAGKATQGNFVGPLVTALAFIPILARTSVSPAILLVNSLAAVIPAPTRGLYAATKASSLHLFQSLAIEHPEIAFTLSLPSTIEGDFRASAVDSGPVREANPNKHGLKLEQVANHCISTVDGGVTGNVFLPWFPYYIGHFLYYLWPSYVEKQARIKYNFP